MKAPLQSERIYAGKRAYRSNFRGYTGPFSRKASPEDSKATQSHSLRHTVAEPVFCAVCVVYALYMRYICALYAQCIRIAVCRRSVSAHLDTLRARNAYTVHIIRIHNAYNAHTIRIYTAYTAYRCMSRPVLHTLCTLSRRIHSVHALYSARTARIYRCKRTSMQAGAPHPAEWRIEWEVSPDGHRWANPVMGWASSGDALQAMQLRFPSRESAIQFAEKHGTPVLALLALLTV